MWLWLMADAGQQDRNYGRPMANMSSNEWPINVVVAGAGVAGLEAVIALRTLAGRRVNITLISAEHDFVYRPLSVGEPFALGEARRIPVTGFAREFDVDLRRDVLAYVDARAHTVTLGNGESLAFDKLIVATGADRVAAYEHAMTFRGQEDAEALHGLVLDVEGGYSHKIAFVVPAGVTWSLPLYELALMTAHRGAEMSADLEISLVTPEERPLAIFGADASRGVQALLDEAGISVHCGRVAEIPASGTIVLHPGNDRLEVERIVALPVTAARPTPGLPSDADGFLRIDRNARVGGLPDVYAVGDGSNFPLKQGGIACQQADAAAEHIAREAGVPLEVHPFRPVLRGKLLTGREPQYMSHDVTGMTGSPDQSGRHMLWWPPNKVAGRYIAPYLAGHEISNVSDTADELDEVELRGYEFAAR
jgi:sulfide:quinone oxidoreductase